MEHIYLNNLGNILKDARKSRKLTREKVAESLDISVRYLSAMENEHKVPSLDLMYRLVRELGISADTIFYPEIENKSNELVQLTQIPELTLIEKTIPIKAISELAKIEGNSKRPIYSIHKWWARRLSSVVRAIILAAFLPYDTTEETFWKAYYQSNDLSKFTVLDTFMGGGTCIVESKK